MGIQARRLLGSTIYLHSFHVQRTDQIHCLRGFHLWTQRSSVVQDSSGVCKPTGSLQIRPPGDPGTIHIIEVDKRSAPLSVHQDLTTVGDLYLGLPWHPDHPGGFLNYISSSRLECLTLGFEDLRRQSIDPPRPIEFKDPVRGAPHPEKDRRRPPPINEGGRVPGFGKSD